MKNLLTICVFFCFAPKLSVAQIKSDKLNQSLSRGVTFLLSQQKESGSFQDSTDHMFNVWETIICTKALVVNESAIQTNINIQKALNWLSSNEHSSGLICHNEKCITDFCVETSMLYLDLKRKIDPTFQFTNEMLYLEKLQEEDGSWKVQNPDVQFDFNYPSVTAFVLNFSTQQTDLNLNTEKASAFLISKLIPNQLWGSSWEYYGSESYTLWQALPALAREEKNRTLCDSLISWIIGQQLANGAWNFQQDRSKNCISIELETAFVLNALLKINRKENRKNIEKGIQFLIGQQLTNGGWNGGFFPIPNQRYKKKEYLVATSLIVEDLKLYQSLIRNE